MPQTLRGSLARVPERLGSCLSRLGMCVVLLEKACKGCSELGEAGTPPLKRGGNAYMTRKNHDGGTALASMKGYTQTTQHHNNWYHIRVRVPSRNIQPVGHVKKRSPAPPHLYPKRATIGVLICSSYMSSGVLSSEALYSTQNKLVLK